MAKMNLQSVSKFRPKARDSRVVSAQRIRSERLGQLDMPMEFTLEVGLIVDDGLTARHCSRHLTPFLYSVAKMRWENTRPVQWTSTLNCQAIAVSYWHPAYAGKELMRVLLDEVQLEPGSTLVLDAGSLILDSGTGFGITFPPEDYTIWEEPDDVDWQEKFAAAVNYKYKPRKRKRFGNGNDLSK
jgi:hypothetical protein